MKILCLDIGTKRIGVAASDPFGWTAQPLCMLERRGDDKILKEIEKLCAERAPELIIVGLPLDAEGREGPQAKKIRKFAEKIAEHLQRSGMKIPVEMWDERYSTAEAEEKLIGFDVSRKRRREVIDKMAAAGILEDYLKTKEK